MSERTTALALTLAIGIAGCGKSERPKPNNDRAPGPAYSYEVCTPYPNSWSPLPEGSVVATSVAAEDLGVSQEAIINGKYGSAICKTAVTKTELDTTPIKISVLGEGNRCLIIGVMPPKGKKPAEGVKYNDVIALCASEGAV